ncbi:DHA2 family efflux MFS transporter permease subunit [Sabulicella rubraurantiaca]|uniref:DHA2 family efflux MFS transporter permease subunit n=1 Tax=Sabulicella rubraurantiaca TaxID=2811429 RepID=UPI001A970C19|nr:DHA2 family efflux MFS transporter permease subunit [Sabulicella rubraurantiaca]
MNSGGPSVAELFARYGPAYRWWVTLAALTGTVSCILSSTIVVVAQPDIVGALGMGHEEGQLLATGFLAANTGFMLLNAWAVERFGFRITYVASISIFVLASVAAGVTNSASVMVLARVAQGASAGLLQPLSMQVIFLVFPPERRGTAMGLFSFGVVMAPAMGPAAGGLLVDAFSWHAVFFLCLPTALLGLLLGLVFMPGRASASDRRFDLPGAALLALAIGLLLAGLTNGQHHGWESDTVRLQLVGAALATVGFVGWQAVTPAPLMNLAVFRHGGFVAAAMVAFIYGAAMFASTYLLPLLVQLVQGYTPTRSGMILMPGGLVVAFVFLFAGRMADWLPPWIPICLGLAIFAASSALMGGVGTDTPFWTLAFWILLGRIGLGLAMPNMNVGAMRALPAALLAQGAGAINFFRMLGGAFGTNLLAVHLERRTAHHAEALNARLEGGAAVLDARRLLENLYAQGGLPEVIRRDAAHDFLTRMVEAQGLMLGFRDAFIVTGMLCLLAILPGLTLRQKPPGAALRPAPASRPG